MLARGRGAEGPQVGSDRIGSDVCGAHSYGGPLRLHGYKLYGLAELMA